MKKKLIIFGCIAVVAVLAIVIMNYFEDQNVEIKQVRTEIEMEAGSELDMDVYSYISSTDKVMKAAKIDASGVKTDTVGKYIMTVSYKDRVFDVFVNVIDTTPPVIKVENNSLLIGVNTTFKLHELPIDIDDLSRTAATLSNGKEAMHYDVVGDYKDTITVTDEYGNSSSQEISIKVADLNPPVISGNRNFQVYEGTPINPMAGVTAKDIEDGDITSKIQVSEYNVRKIGTQTITYTVSDDYGNVTTVTSTLRVLKIPETSTAPANRR